MMNRKVIRSLLASYQFESLSELKLWDCFTKYLSLEPTQPKLVPVRIESKDFHPKPNNHHY